MITGFFHACRAAIGPLCRGDVRFVTQDGLDVLPFAGRVKLQRPVHVAVIGDGERVHAVRLCLGDQIGNAIGSIQQAVMRVAM